MCHLTFEKSLRSTSISLLNRYHHAAVCVPTVRGMFVFGGINGRGIALKELWKFSLDSNRWSRLNVSSTANICVTRKKGNKSIIKSRLATFSLCNSVVNSLQTD